MNIPPDLSNAFDTASQHFDATKEHSEDQLPDADSVAHLWVRICSCFVRTLSTFRITKEADGNRRYVLVEKTSKSIIPGVKDRHKCVFIVLCREQRENLNDTYWEHSTHQLREYIETNFKLPLHLFVAIAVVSKVRVYQYVRGTLAETMSPTKPFDLSIPHLRLWCLKDVRDIFVYAEMSLLTLLLNKGEGVDQTLE